MLMIYVCAALPAWRLLWDIWRPLFGINLALPRAGLQPNVHMKGNAARRVGTHDLREASSLQVDC